jgi:hypothetical protein
MKQRYVTCSLSVALILLTIAILGNSSAVTAYSPQIIYNSVSSPLVYLNSQAWGGPRGYLSELGEQISFAGWQRMLGTVTLTMSDWACETGGWGNDNCLTTPGAVYYWPITLNIYAVKYAASPCPSTETLCPTAGKLIASETTVEPIPYRPSADPTHCPDNTNGNGVGEWYNTADGKCHNGYNFNIIFDFTALCKTVTLPDQIIFGIAYTIPGNGYSSTDIGPADSLNVAYVSNPPTVGTDPNPNALFRTASVYCDGSATWTGACSPSYSNYDNVGYSSNGPVNVFRQDLGWATGCGTGVPCRLSVEFTET